MGEWDVQVLRVFFIRIYGTFSILIFAWSASFIVYTLLFFLSRARASNNYNSKKASSSLKHSHLSNKTELIITTRSLS